MNYRNLTILLALCLLTIGPLAAQTARAHCEVPCGIYDDEARIESIREDITTVAKAMDKISSLGREKHPNYNQIVRWTNTKEEHAQKIQHTVWQYFLTQRIKPVEKDSPEYKDYQQKLEVLHHMLVTAMKCKQTTDPANTEKLKSLLDKFHKLYFSGPGHKH